MTVFDKNTCELLTIRELLDRDKEWVNFYPLFAGAGFKVLWYDGTDSIYLMLQTLGTTALTQGSLYLLNLDQSLNILNSVRHDNPSTTWFLVSDMVMDDAFLHLVGVHEQMDGNFVLTHLLVSKSSLSTWSKFDVSVIFPDYDISSLISLFNPPRVYASYSQLYNGYILYIAFSILCSGADCSEDGSDTVRPAILWCLPPGEIRELPWSYVQLYKWNTIHWNYQSPYSHSNNTWVTDIAEAGGILYVVGFIGENPDPNMAGDGFVIAVEAKTPDTVFEPEMLEVQYFLRLASLMGEASGGGQKGISAVLGAGSYNGYAYITGSADNYYLEYGPFNPSNITGVTEIQLDRSLPLPERPDLTDLRNLSYIGDNDQLFDRDVSDAPAGFYGVLRLRPSGITTITSTTTDTLTTTSTFTTTERTATTVISTPTTIVTRRTTTTRTALTTRLETEYVLSTVYTTRTVEDTSIRYETVASLITLTDTVKLSRIVTATTTPVVYATVRETVSRNQTVLLTRTIVIQPEGQPPWVFLVLPFLPLLLVPPPVMTVRRRLTIAILEGAGEQPPRTQKACLLNEYFKPSVGKLRRGGKVIFVNRDKASHEIELYRHDQRGKEIKIRLEPGRKTSIKVEEPGRYVFRLATGPDKIGVLEVE